MSARQRDRLEILAEIVEFLAVKGPQYQTRILGACNLKYEQTRECVAELVKNGLIERDETTEKLRVTEIGIDFLRHWTRIFRDFLASHPVKTPIWRPISCPKCAQSFSSSEELGRHTELAHPQSIERGSTKAN